MLTAHLLVAVVFGGAAIGSLEPASKQMYVVAWAAERNPSEARQALVEQVDRGLRDELGRRGVVVSGAEACAGAIVLVPQLDVLPNAVKLSLIEVSYPGRAVVGTVTAKMSGAGRATQLRALITRAVDEAGQL